MSDGTVACTRPPAGWACSRGDGHEGPCAATAQSLPPASPTDMDVRRLAAFLKQEFPNAVSRAAGTEVVVNTAMALMAEMKIALDAQGAAPEEGW